MTIPNDLRRVVFEVPNFESCEFCERITARAFKQGFRAATIVTEDGTSVTPHIRNNDRVIFDDHALAKAVWQKTRALFSTPFKGHRAVGLNERFRVYRYGPEQFFDWHQDGEYHSETGLRSLFTMMIYLSDRCKGGGTSFADVFSPYVFNDFTISPKQGKALFFHHPLSHRGDKILSGEKFVLRTDVMFSPDA